MCRLPWTRASVGTCVYLLQPGVCFHNTTPREAAERGGNSYRGRRALSITKPTSIPIAHRDFVNQTLSEYHLQNWVNSLQICPIFLGKKKKNIIKPHFGCLLCLLKILQVVLSGGLLWAYMLGLHMVTFRYNFQHREMECAKKKEEEKGGGGSGRGKRKRFNFHVIKNLQVLPEKFGVPCFYRLCSCLLKVEDTGKMSRYGLWAKNPTSRRETDR